MRTLVRASMLATVVALVLSQESLLSAQNADGAPAATPATDQVAGSATLKLTSSGAASVLGYYRPLNVTLSDSKPATIKKLPADLANPLYGIIKIAGATTSEYQVVLDEPAGKPFRLFVDANGNRDLTDDPAAEWAGQPSVMRDKDGKVVPLVGTDGKPCMNYFGGATLHLGTTAAPYDVHLGMYRFDAHDPQRAALQKMLFYYRDYMTQGDLKIGDKAYRVALVDDVASGNFQNGGSADKPTSNTRLLVDFTQTGKVDTRNPVNLFDPFNVGGITYEMRDVAPNGLSFNIVKSSRHVDPPKAPLDLAVGKKTLTFQAKTTDGNAVNFPADFKGKIVMLDFWATWCGPCMEEVPGLVSAYNQVHGQGFEILGISLDQPDSADKVKTVTADKGMTWRQVYDGKYWKAETAVLYDIQAIPAGFLVDGDTSEILAAGNSLRGTELLPTLKAALAKKAGKSK
jgi:thiol-disulfide isomerase/thioredoxin